MRYTKVPSQQPAKPCPTLGSLFIMSATGSLAVVIGCPTPVEYVVLCTGYRTTMPLSAWRHLVHVEQAENLIVREID